MRSFGQYFFACIGTNYYVVKQSYVAHTVVPSLRDFIRLGSSSVGSAEASPTVNQMTSLWDFSLGLVWVTATQKVLHDATCGLSNYIPMGVFYDSF